MGGNGHRPGGPTPITGHGVPIVGQPFEVNGFQITLLLTCKCDPTGVGHPLLVTNQGPTQCAACKKAYTVQALSVAPGQEPHFGIACMIPKRHPASDSPDSTNETPPAVS